LLVQNVNGISEHGNKDEQNNQKVADVFDCFVDQSDVE
jgi:hypothetical protein